MPQFYCICNTSVAFFDTIKSQKYRGDFMQYTQSLEELRKARDLNQEQVAKLLNLTREQYRKYQTDKNEVKT